MRKRLVLGVSWLAAGLLFCSGARGQQTPASGTGSAPAAKTPASKPTAGSPAKPESGTAAKSDAPAELKTDKEKGSYAVGVNIGNRLKQQPVDLDLPSLFRGIKDAESGAKPLLTDGEIDAELKMLNAEAMAKMAENNLKAGQVYLAANKSKDGVVTTASGLQYKILSAGTGPKPVEGDTVSCNYRGTFIDGTEFDSSAKHGGKPAEIQLGHVIKGWNEALEMMPVGSKWQLVIPPDLAYGVNGFAPVIGPNETLVFEVELVSINGK